SAIYTYSNCKTFSRNVMIYSHKNSSGVPTLSFLMHNYVRCFLKYLFQKAHRLSIVAEQYYLYAYAIKSQSARAKNTTCMPAHRWWRILNTVTKGTYAEYSEPY